MLLKNLIEGCYSPVDIYIILYHKIIISDMESKQCTNCKRTLLFEDFKVNTRTGQYTKLCIKCLDMGKKSREKNKCERQKRRSRCKACRGSGICEHQKIRSECKECGGGSICEHQKRRSSCKDCGGGSICSHKIQRRHCKICNPIGHLASIVRNRTYDALKHNKEMHSTEYLGCTIEEFREHIELQFKEGMTWSNHGDWHIDHKIPIAYKQDGVAPTIEEVAKRLHYTNTQPLWASENMSKCNRYIS